MPKPRLPQPVSPTPADHEDVPAVAYGWSAGRHEVRLADKHLMAKHFTHHDFLVPADGDPELDGRQTAATVLVSPGTTPNKVVEQALQWCAENWNIGPFSITWHSPGTLVPATLRRFKEQNYRCLPAGGLALFPGVVDNELDSVIGDAPVQYIQKCLRTRFSHAILSAYAFDMATGQAFFHFSSEVSLQRELAGISAGHKYLFLDPTKLEAIEGEEGYGLRDLLGTAQAVSIYTVESSRTALLVDQFRELSRTLLPEAKGTNAPNGGSRAESNGRRIVPPPSAAPAGEKRLRLCVVRERGPAITHLHRGYLNIESR